MAKLKAQTMPQMPSMPSMQSNAIMRYVLIAALVVLLGFAIMYIVNIQKASKEAFNNNFQVVYIYSDSCGYCTKFTPTFNTYAQSAPTGVQISAFEKTMPGAGPYMSYVSAFPTVLVLNNGKLVNSKSGNMSLADLSSYVSASTTSSEGA